MINIKNNTFLVSVKDEKYKYYKTSDKIIIKIIKLFEKVTPSSFTRMGYNVHKLKELNIILLHINILKYTII
jgi:hypothetical protein